MLPRNFSKVGETGGRGLNASLVTLVERVEGSRGDPETPQQDFPRIQPILTQPMHLLDAFYRLPWTVLESFEEILVTSLRYPLGLFLESLF